jgi:predicted nucleic-acid-binding Zn-ribbon protein
MKRNYNYTLNLAARPSVFYGQKSLIESTPKQLPMSTSKTCPKCNGAMKKSKDLSAIVTATKGIKSYSIKTNRFIPARTYTCQECGYIELYYDTG